MINGRQALLFGGYTFILVLNLIFVDCPIELEKSNPNENIANYMEIYGVNKTIIKKEEDITPKEVEVLKFAKDNLDFEENDVEVIGEMQQVYWAYSLTECISYDEDLKEVDAQNRLLYKFLYPIVYVALSEDMENFNYDFVFGKFSEMRKIKTDMGIKDKFDYVIYFKKSAAYDIVKNGLFKNGEVIFENDSGGVVKYAK